MTLHRAVSSSQRPMPLETHKTTELLAFLSADGQLHGRSVFAVFRVIFAVFRVGRSSLRSFFARYSCRVLV